MAITLNDLVKDNYDPELYSEGFTSLLEHYMQYMRDSDVVSVVNLDSHLVYKFEGDFYSLLSAMDIPKSMHWITLRLNRLTNPCHYSPDITFILVPDITFINSVLEKYKKKNS